jgi:hypothetical protein
MEAVYPSEALVNIYQTIRLHITEDSTLLLITLEHNIV